MYPDDMLNKSGERMHKEPSVKTIIRVPLPREDGEKKEAKEISSENRIREDRYLAMLTQEEKEGKLGWESVGVFFMEYSLSAEINIPT